MTSRDRSRASVVAAAAVPAILALLLAARLAAQGLGPGAGEVPRRAASAPVPPSGRVPAIPPIDLAKLTEPTCWSCRSARPRPLRLDTELDLLAPLGDGTTNAAVWLADFAPDGPRNDEFRVAMGRRITVELGGRVAHVLPADDPLLREAEPWTAQAECSFYPAVWPLSESLRTRLEPGATHAPNNLFHVLLASSWVARGEARGGAEAMEDFRRTIRLGRLLLQDDTSTASHLVGLKCIRMGAAAIFRHARASGDASSMLVASLVHADAVGIHHAMAERATPVRDLATAAAPDAGLVRAAAAAVREDPERCLRLEAALAFGLVRGVGGEVRAAATEALKGMTRDADPLVAAQAKWVLENELREDMEGLLRGGA